MLRISASLGSLEVYGSDAEKIRALAASSPALAKLSFIPALPYIAAEVVWAAREEMARTVEDVLARHTRALFLNAAAAIAMAEPVAETTCRRARPATTFGPHLRSRSFRTASAAIPGGLIGRSEL